MINPSQRRSTLVILGSHPVQYHAPVYQAAHRLAPGMIKVVYASDCSVRGYRDSGFGRDVKWDIPLLEGYSSSVLNSERGVPLSGPLSLHGRTVYKVLSDERPNAVLFTSLAYEFFWVAYFTCVFLGIPIWLRLETQDAAIPRGKLKAFLRSFVYRALYSQAAGALYIGELNRRHFLDHGISAQRLLESRYCVVDRFAHMTAEEKSSRRSSLRKQLEIDESEIVIAFFGKLIPKKNPGILLDAWNAGSPAQRARWRILYVGDGELADALKSKSEELKVPTRYAGFVNQGKLEDFYLASDIVILPSRREGETWGLVINEALLAGCAVIISGAAGCSVEFGKWSRARVFPPDGAGHDLARLIAELEEFERSFDWCGKEMSRYSVASAAEGIAVLVRRYQ